MAHNPADRALRAIHEGAASIDGNFTLRYETRHSYSKLHSNLDIKQLLSQVMFFSNIQLVPCLTTRDLDLDQMPKPDRIEEYLLFVRRSNEIIARGGADTSAILRRPVMSY
jgi:hypothetical protein